MGLIALVLFLLVYNNLLNLWPPFNERLYVPANLLLTALLAAVALQGFGLGTDQVLGTGAPGPAIRAGLALGVLLAAPLFGALAAARGARRIADRRLADLDRRGAAYQIIVRVPVGTALLEEVAFRGVLFAALRHLGDVEAALWSSVVFGLWHVGPTRNLVRANRPAATGAITAGAIAVAVAGTAIAGLGFVWLRLWTGSLWGPWALHASLNSLATLAAVLAHRRLARDATRKNPTEGVEAAQ